MKTHKDELTKANKLWWRRDFNCYQNRWLVSIYSDHNYIVWQVTVDDEALASSAVCEWQQEHLEDLKEQIDTSLEEDSWEDTEKLWQHYAVIKSLNAKKANRFNIEC